MFPRILAVSDLHANWEWFAWVIRHAPRFDLVCLGGDLCEIFTERATLREQHQSILDRLSRLAATGRPLAVAEGNHDAARPGWLGPRPGLESVKWPGFSEEICVAGRSLVLTVCRDTVVDGVNAPGRIADAFEAGAAARDRTGSPWLVIHHEPPERTPICAGADGNRLLTGLVARHQPDLVVCAHIHEAPFERDMGGHWHCRVGRTLLVNAGQWPRRRWPCHFLIDGDTVTWRAPGHPRESVRFA